MPRFSFSGKKKPPSIVSKMAEKPGLGIPFKGETQTPSRMSGKFKKKVSEKESKGKLEGYGSKSRTGNKFGRSF